jgi:hypothetical protein
VVSGLILKQYGMIISTENKPIYSYQKSMVVPVAQFNAK